MPLNIYIDCITGEYYAGLIISGKANEDILKNHFQELSIYFIDLSGSNTNKIYVGLLKQHVRLQSRLLQLSLMINFYFRTKNIEVKKLMSKQGFFFEKDLSDSLLLKNFEGFAKNIQINIEHVEKDIEDFEKESGESKITRQIILRNIVEMGKHNYKVNLTTDTAEFYFITAKAFSEFSEAQKAA